MRRLKDYIFKILGLSKKLKPKALKLEHAEFRIINIHNLIAEMSEIQLSEFITLNYEDRGEEYMLQMMNLLNEYEYRKSLAREA